MIIPFGNFFGEEVEDVGASEDGLLFLDAIVDDKKLDPKLKEEIKEYLKKHSHRLDALID